MSNVRDKLYLIPTQPHLSNPTDHILCICFLTQDFEDEIETFCPLYSKEGENELYYEDSPIAGKNAIVVEKDSFHKLCDEQIKIYKRFKLITLQSKLLSCNLQ